MVLVKKATGLAGVSASLLKYACMSITPSLTSVFEHSVKACKSSDQWKIASVSAAFQKRTRGRQNMLQTTVYAQHTKTVN